MNMMSNSQTAAWAPSPPAYMVVRRLFTGTNIIKWKHSRKEGETFVVERRIKGERDWSILSFVDDVKYNDMDHQGERILNVVR